MPTPIERLKSYFLNGSKPTEAEFHEWIDSYIHKEEDGLHINDDGHVGIGVPATEARLTVDGAVQTGELNVTNRIRSQHINATDSITSRVMNTDELFVSNRIRPHEIFLNGRLSVSQIEATHAPSTTIRVGQESITSTLLVGSSAFNTSLVLFGNLSVSGQARKPGELWDPPSSDKRVKSDIKNFDVGLEVIEKLEPKTFKFNGKGDTPNDGVERIGLLAQDVQEVFPPMVNSRMGKLDAEDENETEIYSINASPLIYMFLNSIKELSQRVNELEKKVKELEGE